MESASISVQPVLHYQKTNNPEYLGFGPCDKPVTLYNWLVIH
jgi:hypothetical protein